ncbi:hypothetical protein CAEBREN_02196 [Caenorhabditis brenneri]|uniref:Uncharacterized protein n=1 Tax=Caenorhabditis brenneri TaxID=135651 RepID=G0NY49_CAEBE|nr:hypothetical protein CAEBREN_02196 [Caenorhabditis brenneri]
MLSYKVVFALLVVIGMTAALPIGGGGSGSADLSGISAILHEIRDALAELQSCVSGAFTHPSLPPVTIGTSPEVTFPTLPPVEFTEDYTLPPVSISPSV